MTYPVAGALSPAVECIELSSGDGIHSGHALPELNQVGQRHHIHKLLRLLPAKSVMRVHRHVMLT